MLLNMTCHAMQFIPNTFYVCFFKNLEKLNLQLTEADAAVDARKKRPEDDAGPKIVGEGLGIDEWVSYPNPFHISQAFISKCTFSKSFFFLYYYPIVERAKGEISCSTTS